MGVTNLILRDDALVDHTVACVSQGPNSVSWRGLEAGVPRDGQIRLSANWEQLKDMTWRTTLKLEVPILETINAAGTGPYIAQPKVSHVIPVIMTMFAPARSTDVERSHAIRMMAHAVVGATNAAGGSTFNPYSEIAGDVANVNSNSAITYLFVKQVPPT